MSKARTLEDMSPGLLRVMERARRNPRERQFSLAYLIDVEALRRAYDRIRKNAAVGVDGITKEVYGEDLEANLQDLHQRLKTMKYRHQPILRVHIEKERGKTRPIGISTVEDKIVQDAGAGSSAGPHERGDQEMCLHPRGRGARIGVRCLTEVEFDHRLRQIEASRANRERDS